MSGVRALLEVPALGDDLARVEDALQESVRSDDPFLTQVAGHLIAAGGKRLRPALTLAAAAIGSGSDCASAPDPVIQAAVAVELVHLGSLYHDDVMDEAATRRGVETVNARWGNFVAILAGDFLLARASEIAAALGPEPAALLASTIASLCEGQVSELSRVFDVGRSEPAYLTSISRKTAALMAASCRIGALVRSLERPAIEALTTFGQHFGMAFQIVDDVLDVVATDEALGKPAGNDLRAGVYTLPVIRALASAVGQQLREMLGRPLDPAEMARARDLVRSNGAVDAALGVARGYAADAGTALEILDEGRAGSTAVKALRRFADELVESVPAMS